MFFGQLLLLGLVSVSQKNAHFHSAQSFSHGDVGWKLDKNLLTDYLTEVSEVVETKYFSQFLFIEAAFG